MASGASCSVTITQNSQSVANNTSSVTISVKVTSWGNTYNQLGAPGTITFGGKLSGSRSFTAKFGKNANVTVFSQTFTVSHNADGTASVSASVSINTNTSAGTIKANATKTLTTIPRASSPSVAGQPGDGDWLGEELTITTNRKSNSFTHTLTWSWAGKSGTIATNVGASTKWTPDIATFAPYLTNATSADCTITCITYNGSTNIGSKTITFKLGVPTSVVPSFASSSVTDGNGYLSTYGAFVQGKSNVQATAEADGLYGSTITGVTASLDGLSASGDNGGTLTLGAPPTAGSRSVKLVATDSRGRSITGTKAITVVEYSNPTLSVTAYRCDASSGVEDDESTTVRVAISGGVHNVNGKGINTGTVKIESKLETAEVWTTKNSADRGQEFSFNFDITGMDTANRYNIRVTVTDDFGVSAEIGLMIMTAQPVLDFHSSGHGIGIGVVANQENLLDIGYDMLARGDVDMSLDSQMAFNGAPFLQPQQSTGRPTLVNHIGLANGMWLQGQLASGNFTNMLRMNADGQVELNWTTGGLKGRVMKELWSGTWSSGNITVPDLPYYNMLLLGVSNSYTQIGTSMYLPVFKDVDKNSLFGITANYTGADVRMYLSEVNISSSTVLSFNNGAILIDFQYGSRTFVISSKRNIYSIIGVL